LIYLKHLWLDLINRSTKKSKERAPFSSKLFLLGSYLLYFDRSIHVFSLIFYRRCLLLFDLIPISVVVFALLHRRNLIKIRIEDDRRGFPWIFPCTFSPAWVFLTQPEEWGMFGSIEGGEFRE